jgi:hypothetical protein
MVVTSREKLSLCHQKNKQTNKARKQAHHKNKQSSLEEMCAVPKKKQESRTRPLKPERNAAHFIIHQRRKTRRAPKQGTQATKTTAFFQLSKK